MQRIEYPRMGFGCVNLNDENSSIIDNVISQGCNLFDTADCYGGGQSEIALGRKLKKYPRKDMIVCTKIGLKFSNGPFPEVVGDPAYVKEACEASLKRLQMDYIDLLQLHRIDPRVPIETTMQALKELVLAKKIRAIGLSEVTASQIRRAHAVHPISAVQIEYSPWATHDEENDVINTCLELDIRIIAYSPLGRALFADTTLTYFAELPQTDYRRTLPRYLGNNLEQNLEAREALINFANNKGCTLAQLVLAWEMHKGYLPIPATTNVAHFKENYKAINITFSNREFSELEEIIKNSKYYGERYLSEKHSAIYPDATPGSNWYLNNKATLFGLALIGAAGVVKVSSVLAQNRRRPG